MRQFKQKIREKRTIKNDDLQNNSLEPNFLKWNGGAKSL